MRKRPLDTSEAICYPLAMTHRAELGVKGRRRGAAETSSPLCHSPVHSDERKFAGTRLEAAVHALLEATAEAEPLGSALLDAVADPSSARVPPAVEHALREVADAAIESGTSWPELSDMLSSACDRRTRQAPDRFSTPPSSPPRSPLKEITSNTSATQPTSAKVPQHSPQQQQQQRQYHPKPCLRSQSSSLRARVQRLEQKTVSSPATPASNQLEQPKAEHTQSSLPPQHKRDEFSDLKNAWQRVELLSNELQETREQLAAAHSSEAAQRERARRESARREQAEQRALQAESSLQCEHERSSRAEQEATSLRCERDELKHLVSTERERAETAKKERDEALKEAKQSRAKMHQANGALDGAKAAMRHALEDKRKAEAALAKHNAPVESNGLQKVEDGTQRARR